ncbi:MAG: NAD(P)H-dependent oxidoreductase [Verrucomicrobiota bacterium]
MKTLILFAHPAWEKSVANRALIEAAREVPGVTVRDLYALYPDFFIRAKEEQAALQEHDRLVWQHPLYWYSTPSLLKEWMDVVLEYGWAYGEGGDALRGKTLTSVVTAGGSKEVYCEAGRNRFSVAEFLRPCEQTARLCGMTYGEPIVFYEALELDLKAAVETYGNWLRNDGI